MFEKLRQTLRDFGRAMIRRTVLIPLLGAVTVLMISVSVATLNTYIVYDGSQVQVHNTHADTVAAALREMGVEVGEHDKMQAPGALENGVAEIYITRGGDVTIHADGKSSTLYAGNETVESALRRAGVTWTEEDVIEPALSEAVTAGMDIKVTRVRAYRTERLVEVPYQQVTRQSETLAQGKRSVVTAGVPGQKKQVYGVKVVDGEVVSETLLSEQVVKEPVNEVINVGTRATTLAAMSSTSRGGMIANLRYSKVLDVEATAYSTEKFKGKYTATGVRARVGLIATDPNVIPMGTRMFITSADGKSWVYGYAVAADKGSAIKGLKIDLFFDTHKEACQFGRRKAKVYILE